MGATLPVMPAVGEFTWAVLMICAWDVRRPGLNYKTVKSALAGRRMFGVFE